MGFDTHLGGEKLEQEAWKGTLAQTLGVLCSNGAIRYWCYFIPQLHAGHRGSGCGCAATTLSAYILPKIESGEWKRVLFVPTGALMSTVSYNEGQSVPGIAHGIVLEHC